MLPLGQSGSYRASPPRWALRWSATVLTRGAGENEHGEELRTWVALEGAVRCALYPVSDKALERAGLLGVQVNKEAFLERSSHLLRPNITQLRIAEKTYWVRDVNDWSHFLALLLEEVTP